MNELKAKLASVDVLGNPNNVGEVLLITDAWNVGGDGVFFQWQNLKREQIPPKFKTTGVKGDG